MLKKRMQAGAQEGPRLVNGVLKFKELPCPPELDLLRQMLEHAQKAGGKVVEQQWLVEDRNEIFILRCSAAPQEEPVWVFLTGPLSRMPTEKWNYPSTDVTLIHQIIHSETQGAMAEIVSDGGDMLAPSVAALTVALADRSEPEPSANQPPPRPAQQVSTKQQIETGTHAILQGDLVLVQLPTVLQSIQMSKMTGRLELRNQDGTSDVYFDDGRPVHAQYCGASGDIALIELLSWQDGKFRFFPDERTAEHSIKNRLDSLLVEGMTFADQNMYLNRHGLTTSTYLIRKRPEMTQVEFETILQAHPVDVRLAGNFYCQIDDTRTLLDILRVMPLHKTEWVPLLFQLITQGILVPSEKPARSRPVLVPAADDIDFTAIEASMRGCFRADTGVLNYGALLFFMQQEFSRYEAAGVPFSLLLFEGLMNFNREVRPLPEAAAREMIRRTKSMIRPFEIFSHYKHADYALLLPMTDVKTAALVAQRLLEAFKTIPIVETETYEFRIGVAGIPSDGNNVASMLASAQLAKQRAIETRSAMVLFRTLLS
ncbi:MAG: DUF4388 domain-containing protein [Candidatus Melainabacteria bacterium]|nr:DUF4388 domain-containing protein [Candidatus Melainabacteria bacterium]